MLCEDGGGGVTQHLIFFSHNIYSDVSNLEYMFCEREGGGVTQHLLRGCGGGGNNINKRTRIFAEIDPFVHSAQCLLVARVSVTCVRVTCILVICILVFQITIHELQGVCCQSTKSHCWIPLSTVLHQAEAPFLHTKLTNIQKFDHWGQLQIQTPQNGKKSER